MGGGKDMLVERSWWWDGVGDGPHGIEGFPGRKPGGQEPDEKCGFNSLKGEQSSLLGT